MVAAIVVASVIILTQCFSNHENDSGTSIMVEVSATENEFDKIMNRCCEVMEKRIQLFCEDEPGKEQTTTKESELISKMWNWAMIKSLVF